jgi:hypothetical protein
VCLVWAAKNTTTHCESPAYSRCCGVTHIALEPGA